MSNTTMQTFSAWEAQVDQHLINKCGMGIEDLPDYRYYSEWQKGTSAKQCADDAFTNAMSY